MNYRDAILKVIGVEVLGPDWVKNKTSQQIYDSTKNSKAVAVSGDAGGLTKFGISQKAYPNLDIKNLTIDKAIEIYKKDYWDKVAGDKLSYNVAYTLFNMAVNRGVVTAIKNAQKVLGASQDGILGATTLGLINLNPTSFLQKYLAEMVADYREIASNEGPDDKDKKFLGGWLNRINEISDYVGVQPATLAVSSGALIIGVILLFVMFSGKKTGIA